MKIDWEEDWWLAAIPVAVIVGVMVSRSRTAQASQAPTTVSKGGHSYPPPKPMGAPFAGGPARPKWPVGPSHNKNWGKVSYRDVNGTMHLNGARAFGASRGERRHAGIDLYGNPGDLVIAPESGVLVSDQNFLTTIPGDDALMMQGDSGTVLLFGEIKANGFQEFGLQLGSRVQKGQPIGRIVQTANGSHMLHFETYAQGTTKNKKWFVGQAPPAGLLDPTEYLLRAMP
jgi:murein DD-endopeptidase MepM/ murein hydrolase activator NlpD